jgi:leucyl-tRNA synthetase
MAPHITEELWSYLGNERLLAETMWPVADQSLVEKQNVTIAVQVNGKVKTTITLPKDASKEDTENTALKDPNIERIIKEKTLRKVIVVPGRIVNLVVGE